MDTLFTKFNFPIISWDNEEESFRQSIDLLKRLSENRSLLTYLLQEVFYNRELREMCECHSYDDKIVIFSGLETHGYRIRFRLAKQVEQERIHNHRFTAIHHILTGRFHQKFYYPKKQIELCTKPQDFEFIRSESHFEQQSFIVHYKDFHSSETTVGTISLLLRGPTKNKQAIGINCHDYSIRVRKGYQESSLEENISHRMPDDILNQWVDILAQKNIINKIQGVING